MKRSFSSKATAPKGRQAEIQHILAILHKWGVHTLGQLAALDKEQLRARLGPEAVRLWERANGTATRLLKFVQPQESFEEGFEFEREIETAEPLLFMLRRFLEQLAVRLSAIYLVAKELTLRITFSNSRQDKLAVAGEQSYERVFKIPQPTNDVDLLFRMLHTHLENFRSEHPIVAVALSAQPIKPSDQQFGFFEAALPNLHQLSETLACLSALLGTDRVGRPILEDTHRPDAFRMEAFTWQVGAIDLNCPAPRKPASRVALRRFRPAVSASVLLKEDRPGHVCSVDVKGKIVDQRGPYFLSGNWWDQKSWARTEWDLQLEDGELVRAHEADPPLQSYGVASGIWAVDGIYD